MIFQRGKGRGGIIGGRMGSTPPKIVVELELLAIWRRGLASKNVDATLVEARLVGRALRGQVRRRGKARAAKGARRHVELECIIEKEVAIVVVKLSPEQERLAVVESRD